MSFCSVFYMIDISHRLLHPLSLSLSIKGWKRIKENIFFHIEMLPIHKREKKAWNLSFLEKEKLVNWGGGKKKLNTLLEIKAIKPVEIQHNQLNQPTNLSSYQTCQPICFHPHTHTQNHCWFNRGLFLHWFWVCLTLICRWFRCFSQLESEPIISCYVLYFMV